MEWNLSGKRSSQEQEQEQDVMCIHQNQMESPILSDLTSIKYHWEAWEKIKKKHTTLSG